MAMTTLNYSSLPHLPQFVPQAVGDNANEIIDKDHPNSLSEAASKALLSNEHSQLSIHTVEQKLKKLCKEYIRDNFFTCV